MLTGKILTSEEFKEDKIETLKKPDEPQTFWIGIGYFFAIMGGLLGVFIGWFLTTHKKTLPDGERVYGYSESDRIHGRRIFWIGVVVIALSVIVRIAAILFLIDR